MSEQPDMSGRLYELAVAKDAATLIDLDAALALSRTSVRTLIALSPHANALTVSMAEEEIDRLSADGTQVSDAAISLIRSALRG